MSEPSMVPARCGRVSRTSGGVMAKREQTYSSALTNGFLQGVLLNAFVLALVDEGIIGSANCQKALSKGFPDGSSLLCLGCKPRDLSLRSWALIVVVEAPLPAFAAECPSVAFGYLLCSG